MINQISNNMEKKDYKVVLVIGNGFDLDLGLKTKYKDYMDSKDFTQNLIISFSIEEKRSGINLFHYLKGIGHDKENWIDIERELADFAVKHKRPAGELEKRTFSLLRKSLCSYIKNIDYDINISSVAINLLKLLNKCLSYSGSFLYNIISFNYTDLKKLEKIVGQINAPIDYVHGSILDDSIILGFEDTLDIDESFSFMIKTFSPYYTSHNVRAKLLDADEIIFFGHSLGRVDYHYFEDLFMYQSQPEKANQKLILRIFTKDESSRINILLRLREMNQKRTDLLYDLCDFRIYRTDSDSREISKYLSELEDRLTIGIINLPIYELNPVKI